MTASCSSMTVVTGWLMMGILRRMPALSIKIPCNAWLAAANWVGGEGQYGFKFGARSCWLKWVRSAGYLVECSVDLVSVRPSNRTKPIQIRNEVLARLDDVGVASKEVLRNVSKSRSRLGSRMSFDKPGTGPLQEQSEVH